MKDTKTQLGYCCINLSLADQGVTANRGMIKATFATKGISYASELALKNLRDLHKILEWNLKNEIFVYRISSHIFPWMSEYELQDLPAFDQISELLESIGDFILLNGIRVSMHPGQFDVLCSPTDSIVNKTIKDLNQHSQIMTLMGLPSTNEFPINIHIGATYGDKDLTAKRFCTNFYRLNLDTRFRLVVENDDKATQYSVVDLYNLIHEQIGVPITFDYHHHRFNDGGLTEEQALKLAASTWEPLIPLVHYSSCRTTFEDRESIPRAHANYIYEKINTYGLDLSIEIEAKSKDLAVLKYRRDNGSLLNEYVPFNAEGYIK